MEYKFTLTQTVPPEYIKEIIEDHKQYKKAIERLNKMSRYERHKILVQEEIAFKKFKRGKF